MTCKTFPNASLELMHSAGDGDAMRGHGSFHKTQTRFICIQRIEGYACSSVPFPTNYINSLVQSLRRRHGNVYHKGRGLRTWSFSGEVAFSRHYAPYARGIASYRTTSDRIWHFEMSLSQQLKKLICTKIVFNILKATTSDSVSVVGSED